MRLKADCETLPRKPFAASNPPPPQPPHVATSDMGLAQPIVSLASGSGPSHRWLATVARICGGDVACLKLKAQGLPGKGFMVGGPPVTAQATSLPYKRIEASGLAGEGVTFVGIFRYSCPPFVQTVVPESCTAGYLGTSRHMIRTTLSPYIYIHIYPSLFMYLYTY